MRSNAPTGTETDVALAQLERVVDLIEARLALMHDVARWKWNAQKPIDDPTREAELLDRLAIEATDHWQIHSDDTRLFFASQISAGKSVQRADYRSWMQQQQRPAFADVPDLATVQRPKLDAVSQELLVEWAALQPHIKDPAVQARVQESIAQSLAAAGVEDIARAEALETLHRDAL